MKIQTKLFFAFLLGSIILVSTMYALMQWSFDKGMMEYINQRDLNSRGALAEQLEALHKHYGSWDFLRDNHRLWRQLLNEAGDQEQPAQQNRRPEPPPRREHRPHRPPGGPGSFNQPRTARLPIPPPSRPPGPKVILLDQHQQAIFGRYDPEQDTPLMPIKNGETVVGWLTVPPKSKMPEAFDVSFVKEQQTAFIVISMVLIVLSAAVSYPLASALTRPIKRLAKGFHALASGNYKEDLNYQSKDELGQLTRDFNTLAKTLAENETARKRWIADISHELRTPIAINRAELEAILDDVRPLTKESVRSNYQEILHLQRIVEDLYELANADIGALSYQKESVDLVELIDDQIEKQQGIATKAGLNLKYNQPETEAFIWGDETRLIQLISNLITNSIKYTDSGGDILVTLNIHQQHARIDIMDSSPGIKESDIPKLFDPLFRCETSRNRKTGGSGLGLAICKKIVEGHNGEIYAQPSPLGGLQISIELSLTHE